MCKKILQNPYIKNILLALIVVIFGFILLNLTFFFYALIINLVLKFFPDDFVMTNQWFMPLMIIVVSLIIAIVSWFVFKSKLKEIYKATFLVVPVAVVLAIIGMFLYRLPIAVFSLSGFISIGILYYFYRAKQPWIYYFSTILVVIVLLIMALTGTEIQ